MAGRIARRHPSAIGRPGVCQFDRRDERQPDPSTNKTLRAYEQNDLAARTARSRRPPLPHWVSNSDLGDFRWLWLVLVWSAVDVDVSAESVWRFICRERIRCSRWVFVHQRC